MHALSKDTDTASAPRCFRRGALGGKVRLSQGNNKIISCESMGFRGGRTPVMPRRPMLHEFANPMRGRGSSQQGAGLAQREAGFSSERPGPVDQNGHGALTGRSAVLVEGAVHNEPVDHAVRNFADQYIVLERNIVERGLFSSTNKFESVRRAMPDCITPQEQSLALTTLAPRADCEVPAEFIRFGARKAGTNGELDIVVERYPHPEVFHTTDEGAAFTECYAVLEKIMDSTPGKGDGS